MKIFKTILPVVYLALNMGLLCASSMVGSFDTSFDDVWDALTQFDASNNIHYSIIHLRIPRFLQALLTGGLLAVCGYLMQSLVNNPLADPYLLGTSGGAALGASISRVWITESFILASVFFSFSGAVLSTLITLIISYSRAGISPAKLLLAGVAMSSLTISLMNMVIYFSSDDDALKSIVYWSFGNFEYSNWNYIIVLFSISIICVPFYSMLNKEMNILLLGDIRAQNLGVRTTRIRWIMLAGTCIMVAITVSCSGPVGFVGLVIPHVVRAMHGVSGRYNIVHSFFTGALFLSFCDLLSRWVYKPSGLPIGIITSLAGIPFFVYLLHKNKTSI
ncbi:MAG: iron ABC transporter permease [Cytophagaceae bacterium]|nr:iron ABC transporter permease [Cytophagaceae bacterium]MDW8455651.1 iron ABC transporter permease [Cytophagaceae bacterium]